MQLATKTKAAINARLEQMQEDGRRKHLGASLIGRSCPRQLAMTFRWFKNVRHEGRLLRLFDRGHKEEARFVEWLRGAGVHVWDEDPNTKKQYRISDCHGHFGGSADGIILALPDVQEDVYCLSEFKTHNDKSFQKLVKSGVQEAKWEHYVQMQCYMGKYNLPYGLYLAINKNDDEIHAEIITLDPNILAQHVERAGRIIFSDELPVRINESPAWFECKWCDYRMQCHFDEIPEVNCRTCAHITPVEDGLWTCTQAGHCIPDEVQRQGCALHIYNPNFINAVEVMDTGVDADGFPFVKYKRNRDGFEFVNCANKKTGLMSRDLCNFGNISKLP